jgi:hypothetical protein
MQILGMYSSVWRDTFPPNSVIKAYKVNDKISKSYIVGAEEVSCVIAPKHPVVVGGFASAFIQH